MTWAVPLCVLGVLPSVQGMQCILNMAVNAKIWEGLVHKLTFGWPTQNENSQISQLMTKTDRSSYDLNIFDIFKVL